MSKFESFKPSKHVIVTGGAGYIGSHATLLFMRKGYRVTVIDNLKNGNIAALKSIEKRVGRTIDFIQVDLLDTPQLMAISENIKADFVLHFAGLKSVSEGNNHPLKYYENNVVGTINLLRFMNNINCSKIVFSSSATVYGTHSKLPYTEAHTTAPINVYGSTKLVCENLINDWCKASEKRKAVILRYFNPVGADPSAIIGEAPKSIINNLMPAIVEAAAKRTNHIKIYGRDYSTLDGTAERDYVHVQDLAYAHYLAVKQNEKLNKIEIFNIGMGRSLSVLTMIKTFEEVTQQRLPIEFTERRIGDLDRYWADTGKSEQILGFKARFGVEEMCRDAWNWELKKIESWT